uniref:Uncharacterized protein n=1 Tax=Peronospora matthiolae TaxID=2874970 RepID=A0AAV1TV38_9STRA
MINSGEVEVGASGLQDGTIRREEERDWKSGAGAGTRSLPFSFQPQAPDGTDNRGAGFAVDRLERRNGRGMLSIRFLSGEEDVLETSGTNVAKIFGVAWMTTAKRSVE